MDTANADINAMLATIDADISDMAEAVDKAIDDAAWAGHVGSFAGPGSTGSLAEAALGFFRSHPNWTGDASKGVKILKVAVRGEWGVAETDSLSEAYKLAEELCTRRTQRHAEGGRTPA